MERERIKQEEIDFEGKKGKWEEIGVGTKNESKGRKRRNGTREEEQERELKR